MEGGGGGVWLGRQNHRARGLLCIFNLHVAPPTTDGEVSGLELLRGPVNVKCPSEPPTALSSLEASGDVREPVLSKCS